MWFTIFSDVSFFCFWSEEIYWLPGFCIIIAPFCPGFVVGNVVRLFLPTSSNTAYSQSLSRIRILDAFYCVTSKMDRSNVCPRQVSRFYTSGKAMILQQVPLLPSIKLNQHSGAVFDYIFLFLLASPFLDSSRTGTATFSKQMAMTSFRMSAFFNTKNFFSEGQKNLVNSENNENLSDYQLLNQKP